MELEYKADSTGAPAVSRVNCKQQSSDIFARLTMVNEEMPQLLQGTWNFQTPQLCFYSWQTVLQKQKEHKERGMQLNLK